ncbi:hypothetical protein MTO96_020550 [Rhipicephalus appendiculatus]
MREVRAARRPSSEFCIGARFVSQINACADPATRHLRASRRLVQTTGADYGLRGGSRESGSRESAGSRVAHGDAEESAGFCRRAIASSRRFTRDAHAARVLPGRSRTRASQAGEGADVVPPRPWLARCSGGETGWS